MIMAGRAVQQLSASVIGFCALVANAQQPSDDLKSWSAVQCQIVAVTNLLKLDHMFNGASLGAGMLAPLEELRRISETAKDQNKSVGEQLKPDQLQRFGELRQQMTAVNLLRLIESKRERDLDVLARMARVADGIYRWHSAPPETSPDYKIYLAIQLMRLASKDRKDDFTFKPFTRCDFDAAVDLMALEPLKRLDDLNSGQSVRVLNELVAKYKTKPINPDRLSPNDRRLYDDVVRDYGKPVSETLEFVRVLEDFKLLNEASIQIYSLGLKDAASSGGNANVVGASIQKSIKEKQVRTDLVVAINVWAVISDTFPPPIFKEFEQLEAAAKKSPKPPSPLK